MQHEKEQKPLRQRGEINADSENMQVIPNTEGHEITKIYIFL
jgi:hypothetical protein